MSLRVCVAVGVVASLAAGALCGLAYYAGNLLADSFTSSTRSLCDVPASGENVRLARGRRICRTCAREWMRRKRAACQ